MFMRLRSRLEDSLKTDRMSNFLWVNFKTEKTKEFFHSRKLHNNWEIYIFQFLKLF